MTETKPQPPTDKEPTGADSPYLARVHALAPRIAAAAGQIEKERRIPGPLLDAMIDAELFRMLLPRSVGGAEVHPLTFMHVIEAMAKTEASPAWNVCQNSVCAMVAAYLPPEVAAHIFKDRRSILAWGPPSPETRAVVCDGGYRVTGSWSFASGGRHATWLGGHVPIYEADGTPRLKNDGTALGRIALFPAEAATLTDVWHVIGLRGTASDTISVEDIFVPHRHTVLRDDLSEKREPGLLYCFRTMTMFACGFASLALGIARALLDELIALAAGKTPRGLPSNLRENAATQSEVGQAEANLRSARSFLMQTVSEICAGAEVAGEVTVEQRMTIRLATTHAIRQARQVGNFAYEAAGTTAIFADNPFERRFRDLNSVAQQLQGRRSHFETVGKFLMGLDADTTFV